MRSPWYNFRNILLSRIALATLVQPDFSARSESIASNLALRNKRHISRLPTVFANSTTIVTFSDF